MSHCRVLTCRKGSVGPVLPVRERALFLATTRDGQAEYPGLAEGSAGSSVRLWFCGFCVTTRGLPGWSAPCHAC
jgi:hypothetical protein